MADKKISELPAATVPLAGTEKFEILQGGVNKQVDASDVGSGGSVTSVSGTTDRITSTGGATPVINLSSVYTLDIATPSTAGATITLDMNSQIQRMFVGSASFATGKTIALSNTTNTLVFNFKFTVTDVAATLTFPSTFIMETIDLRWDTGTQVWTPADVGTYELSATWDGTSWFTHISDIMA